MGGIGLSSTDLNRTPNTPVRTYIRNHTYIYLHTMHNNMHLHRIQNTHICSTSTIQIHTICTQNAHTQTHIYTCKHIHMHREQKYTYMQHTEQNIDTSTENAHRTHTEQDTAQDNREQHTENTCTTSTHQLHISYISVT